jgi:glyoxalase family protein
MSKSAGIHHITAIAGDGRQNVAFYSRLLALRFVKRTVNFDDPSTWHLYYGDETGSPGSALTFFIWGGLPKGRHGNGQAVEIAFAIPQGADEFWTKRLTEKGVKHAITERLGERAISFQDPDGLALELVAIKGADKLPAWSNGEVKAEHAIRGFAGITLRVAQAAATARVLTEVFGFAPKAKEGARQRFLSEPGPLGRHIDLVAEPGARGIEGLGTNHHVAFRAASDEEQIDMRERTLGLGLRATEQVQRLYFRSVYFREPGGILFEIATDDPGFTVDEPKATLGRALKLPPWYEAQRAEIAKILPPIE